MHCEREAEDSLDNDGKQLVLSDERQLKAASSTDMIFAPVTANTITLHPTPPATPPPLACSLIQLKNGF